MKQARKQANTFFFLVFFCFGTSEATEAPWLLKQKGTEYTIDSKQAEKTLKGLDLLKMVTFKIIPEGQELWIEVTSVKPDSPLEQLGIKTGDILQSLNGKSAALDLLIKKDALPLEWQNKKRYELLLLRNKKKITLTYLVL